MELNKIHSAEQPLLKRSQRVYRVTVDGPTPSRIALAQAIGAKEKGTVVVSHVYTETGAQSALVHAAVYHDAAVAESLERANLLAKQKPKQEATTESA